MVIVTLTMFLWYRVQQVLFEVNGILCIQQVHTSTIRAQRLINWETKVLIQSRKSSNIELI